MNDNTRTPRVPDGPGRPGRLWGEPTTNAGLVIEEIGDDHLDIRAVGSFDGTAADRVAARLDQLIASAGHLRIDFRRVTDIDPVVASLFRRAASTVEAAGGTINVIGLNQSFYGTGDPAPALDLDEAPHRHLDTAS